jgi:hypothetical protein
MGTDAEFPHQDRAKRHHDHEVEDVGELYPRQGQQQSAFARWIEGFGQDGMLHGKGNKVVRQFAGKEGEILGCLKKNHPRHARSRGGAGERDFLP